MDESAHDPGGKRAFPLPGGVTGDALFDGPDACYRYAATYQNGLHRGPRRRLMVVGMNPSTATHQQFDPTVAKLWRLAMRMSFSDLLMTNVYAYRATDPKGLRHVDDPAGVYNRTTLDTLGAQADMILMAHGEPKTKAFAAEAFWIRELFLQRGYPMFILQLTRNGWPAHPLYLKNSLQPVPWDGRTIKNPPKLPD